MGVECCGASRLLALERHVLNVSFEVGGEMRLASKCGITSWQMTFERTLSTTQKKVKVNTSSVHQCFEDNWQQEMYLICVEPLMFGKP